MKYSLIFIFVLITISGYGQNGKIRGTVFEQATGEPLIGVTVYLPGTTKGTMTDFDGDFTLEVPEGIYGLQVSYISFQTKLIEGVEVKADKVTVLNTIHLEESTVDLQEVVVSAKSIRNTEAALNTIKRRSPAILDGISAGKMQLIGDATAVEAAKRVTGVSIEEGKYVYVRGLGDRYSKTTLNGMEIPGLDPDRNSLQMDIFPTNLIDNMIVSKTFTAELPADFTGGLMNVETKDFPDGKILSLSLSAGYNPDMHFNPDYLTYNGGKTDFLGFDDGTRALPSGADRSNIPTPISGASRQEVTDFIGSFNPELGASRQKSLLDFSAGLSMGDQIDLGKKKENLSKGRKLGYIFSLSYKSDYKYYDDVIYGEYQRFIDPGSYEMRYATLLTGELGERNILIGMLGGLAFKTNYSKIRLTAMRLQNGESRAGKFTIGNDGAAVGQSGYAAISDNLEYNQRSLTTVLLNGTHLLKNSGWEVDWRLSPTLSTSDDPDIRKTAFTLTPVDTLFVAGAGGNPTRIWRELNEVNVSAKTDISKKYKFNSRLGLLRFGLSHTFKQRQYEILFFDIQFFGGQSWANPDPSTVLNPENLYPNRPNGIYYQSGNNNPNPNSYISGVHNTGFYISNEYDLLPKLKTVLGLRAENYVQRHTGRDQRYASGDIQNGRNLDNEIVLESFDFFPSVNMIFALTDQQNLRASWSRTIARPSFKELSFAQILDPITNRIFNGSLFTYSGWNGKLTETHIDNLDLRWEMYMKNGQLVSVSGFYKKFDDPIELVRIPEQQTSTEYQPRNVGDGILYGVEIEIRKDMEFISQALRHFAVNGNVTFVESRIDMTDTEYNSRKAYEKTGEVVHDSRSIAGQAPYVINVGIGYNNSEPGIEAGLFYHMKGQTLTIVGAGLFPDIYTLPFHSLNFSLSKKFGKEQHINVDFKASNLLNDTLESIYSAYQSANQPYSRINPGRSFSLGLSYMF
jgi:outer membrane receptor protein involved in Fe transport